MFDAGGGVETADEAPAEPEAARPDPTADLHALPTSVLGDDLVDLSAQIGRRNLRLCRALAVFDSKTGHELDGQRTAAAWLAHRTGITRTAARELVKIARRLRDLPAVHTAAEAGELSWEQAKALALAASDATFDLFREVEAELVDACRHLSGADTRRVVTQWRKIAAAQDEKALADADHLGRALYVSKTFEGIYSISGTLDPEAGRIFENALERLMGAQRRNEPTDQTPQDQRTIPQRRADAAVDMAKLVCGWRPDTDGPVEDVVIDGSARPTVELVVDLDTLNSSGSGQLCEYIDLSPLPAETARRISCDCTVGRVLTKGSLPLDIGRQSRTPSRAIRRALDLRDGGCAFPGCDTHPRLCDAHHIVHWADDGTTEIENLVLLCWFHHHLVHEGQWTVTISDATSRPEFHAHDGRTFPATTPRPELPRQLSAELRPDRDRPRDARPDRS